MKSINSNNVIPYRVKRPLFVAAVFAVIFVILWKPFFHPVDFSEGQSLVIQGTVESIEEKAHSTYVFLKHAKVGVQDDLLKKAGDALLIVSDEKAKNLKIGNLISSTCKFQHFEKARNFGNFDEEDYYSSLGIQLKVRAESLTIVNHSYNAILQWLSEFRSKVRQSIEAALQNEELSGLFAAICLGERTGVSETSKSLFRQNGIAHVLAISGLHISLIGMTIFRLLRKFLRYGVAAGMASFFMLCFCLMSGASASSMRATIMFFVQITAIGLGKTYDSLCALSLAAILLMIDNPLIIFNSGFILSFGAVLATALINKPFFQFLIPDLERKVVKNKLLRKSFTARRKWRANWNTLMIRLIQAVILSLSVTLVTLPVIASVYYEIPIFSILLNLIVVPLMSFILGSGLFSGLAGLFSVTLGRFTFGMGVYLLEFIQVLCNFTLQIPRNKIVVGAPKLWRIIAFYLMLLLFVGSMRFINRTASLIRKIRTKIRVGILCIAVIFLLLLLFFSFPQKTVHLYFLDVGQGDGVLIESPKGTIFSIDGGSSTVTSLAKYRMTGAAKYQGISSIDYAIITHPDADHISGIVEILESMIREEKDSLPISTIFIPDFSGVSQYDDLSRLAMKAGVPLISLKKGMKIVENDFSLTCIYPNESPGNSDDLNNNSAVMLLEYGDFMAMFTGDLEEGSEPVVSQNLKEVLGDNQNTIQLLKVAHHGSKYSSSEEFLNALQPSCAVISAGEKNRYGHPHAETLDRLAAIGSRVFSTSTYGEVIVKAEATGKMTITTRLKEEK